MSDKENFDDIIRSALEGHEFPFDENNWDQARTLIDEDRKKRKKRALFLLFFLPGVLLVGVGVWYVVNESIARHLVSEKQKGTTATQKIAPLPEEKTPATSVTIPPDALPANSSSTVAEKTMPAQASTLTDKSDPVAPVTNKKQQEPIPITSSTKEEKPLQKNQQSSDPKQVSPLAVKTGNNPENKQPLQTDPATVPATDDKNPNGVVLSTPAATTVPTTDSIAANADSLKPVVRDSTSLANNAPKDTLLPQLIGKNRITVLAGAAYLFAWEKTDAATPGNGFNPVVGVSYSRSLGRQFAVSAGIQYLSVYNSNSKPLTILSNHYDFGEIREVTLIHPQKLHYMTMPLRISYPAHAKNAFSAGCNIGYLFYSVMETEQYTETAFSRSDINVVRSKGVFNGFNSFDIQAAIAYRRKIYKNFSLEAELFSGLSDVVNNNRFDAGAPQKNRGLKLTLQYDFQKF